MHGDVSSPRDYQRFSRRSTEKPVGDVSGSGEQRGNEGGSSPKRFYRSVVGGLHTDQQADRYVPPILVGSVEPTNTPIYVSSTLISLVNRDCTADISLLPLSLPLLATVTVAALRCHCSPPLSLLSIAVAAVRYRCSPPPSLLSFLFTTVVVVIALYCHCATSPLSLSVRSAASPHLVNSILLTYYTINNKLIVLLTVYC
ncbi:hypothetical protein GW17_00030608 [Ensete ventricosum]|nr:hypothetical protein GW17_00030608 [Ensete ventricosum]